MRAHIEAKPNRNLATHFTTTMEHHLPHHLDSEFSGFERMPTMTRPLLFTHLPSIMRELEVSRSATLPT